MASMVYFRRISEDDAAVKYQFGRDPEKFDRTLSVDRQSGKMLPDDGNVDYMFQKAASKIDELFEERGDWPVKGMSVS